ncbi:hypothetical protein D3C72_2158990 [compost metagenome]
MIGQRQHAVGQLGLAGDGVAACLQPLQIAGHRGIAQALVVGAAARRKADGLARPRLDLKAGIPRRATEKARLLPRVLQLVQQQIQQPADQQQ